MRIDNPLLFGSLRTSGSFLWQASGSFTGSFTGDGSNLTGIVPDGLISSSAQIADAISGSINSLTSSFLTSASVALNTITFTQADGTTSAVTIDTGSAGGSGQGFPFNGDAVITGSLYVSGSTISGSFAGDGSGLTGVEAATYQLNTITVADGKFKFNGVTAPQLNLVRGFIYRFDTSDPSCEFDQLGFRTRNNTTYSDGVSIVGTAGTAGSYTEIHVRFNTPIQLRYYSVTNGNSYGNVISVADQFNPVYESTVTITGSAHITERLGINNDAPQAQVHISSNTNDVLMILEADTDNSNENDNPKIIFRQDGGLIESEIGIGGLATQYIESLDDAAFFGSTTNSPLQFITNDTSRITILGNGNVGIGDKSPDTALHVNGTVSASFFAGDGSQLTNIPAVTSSVEFVNVQNKPTIISSSTQVDYDFIVNTPNNLISSSNQVSYTQITNVPSNIISSSAQINYSGSYETIVVTQSGFQYYIDGVARPNLTLHKGHTYRFDMSDSSNSGHPLAFRTANDTLYTTGVYSTNTAGIAGAYTQIHVGYNTPTHLKYYCTVHGNGMGAAIRTVEAFNTVLSGSAVISGSLSVTGDITAFATSDERLKANVTPILDGLNKIGEIQGYEYDWIENEHHTNTGHDIGVLAQEIEKIAPEAVTTRENGYKAVRYEKLIPVLIQAIKELNDKVKKLEDVHR